MAVVLVAPAFIRVDLGAGRPTVAEHMEQGLVLTWLNAERIVYSAGGVMSEAIPADLRRGLDEHFGIRAIAEDVD